MNSAGREIVVCDSPDDVAVEAARRVKGLAAEAIQRKNSFHFVLAGGGTPRRLYSLLAAPPHRESIEWNKVRLYWGDERCVPPDHSESNYLMAHEALISRVPIPPDNVHRMRGEVDPREAALDYERTVLDGYNLNSDRPRFDLVLLGMGTDGHTASLFPGTVALDEGVRWVVANDVPKLQTTRLTLTLPALNRSAQVFFIVAGADKAEVVGEILSEPAAVKYPAQLINPPHGELTWFLDAAAGSGLKGFA